MGTEGYVPLEQSGKRVKLPALLQLM